MTSIATNAKNDIFVGPDGNLSMVRGLAAVIQDCEHVMKAQLGEMVLALTRGIPTLETIWDEYLPAQFEAYGRRMLTSIEGVQAVTFFNVSRLNGVATYEATIQTVYGAKKIVGSLVQ